MKNNYDICIVGDGIVGLAFALAISQASPLRIALFASPTTPHWASGAYTSRVSAINLASKKFLQRLGTWPAVKTARIQPFTAIEIWDAEKKQHLSFSAAEIARNELGYIIENQLIQAKLYSQVKETSNISLIHQPLVQSVIHDNTVELIDNALNTYSSKLVVGADGAKSWIKQQFDIHTAHHDYLQSALVCHVKTELPHNAIARQIFLAEGPLAFLPLAEANLCSIVWSLPTEQAKKYLQLAEQDFVSVLQTSFHSTLGQIIATTPRQLFPLRAQHAESYIRPNMALIGDAAHVVHPLAGQGVNLGLADAECLTQVIINALAKKQNFASYNNLRRFERARRCENNVMMFSIDTIKRLFNYQNPAVNFVRGLGLKTTHYLPIIKKIFINSAIGN